MALWDHGKHFEYPGTKTKFTEVCLQFHAAISRNFHELFVDFYLFFTTPGVIPNKARAEELATQQFNAAKKEQSAADQSKSSIFSRRRRDKAGRQRRSKSLGKVRIYFWPLLDF